MIAVHPRRAALRAGFQDPKRESFRNGGGGTVDSGKCGKEVPARGVKFKATKPGSETLTIYKDRVKNYGPIGPFTIFFFVCGRNPGFVVI